MNNQFQALGTFSGPNLETTDIDKILEELGYPPSATVPKDGMALADKVAKREILGQITGRFATSLLTTNRDDKDDTGCIEPL